jgi:hypothetical protein
MYTPPAIFAVLITVTYLLGTLLTESLADMPFNFQNVDLHHARR